MIDQDTRTDDVDGRHRTRPSSGASRGAWRPWLGAGLVIVGLLVAIGAWQGIFSSAPEPGEVVPPAAIATAAPEPTTPAPTATATPTPTPTASGAAIPASVLSPAGTPTSVQVISADGESLASAPLQSATLDSDGILAPPNGVAGWYAEPGWARPGWPGASILAGHVRHGSSPDVFWNLPQVQAGDLVVVDYDSGQSSVFRVTRSEAMHKEQVPRDDSIWDHASPTPKLALITCDPATPTRSDGHLEGNWVVWAEPLT